MQLDKRTILITGGSRGIGRALVVQLLAHNPAAIIIVGRDQRTLDELAMSDERIVAYCADLADPVAVDGLAGWVGANHPELSILINNAGSQLLTDLVSMETPSLIAPLRQEISVNFDGVIALTLGLMPVLLVHRQAMVVNVTSGLALAPKQSSPVYCATKAGLRSFTKTLRYQADARAPQLNVVEALPPLVDTDMTEGRGRGKISAEECALQIVAGMRAGKSTIYVGKSKLLRMLLGISPNLVDRIMRNG